MLAKSCERWAEGMPGGTVVEYMTFVHRVQAAMCTSQYCHGHYNACGCPHDLHQTAVDRMDICRALEVAPEVVQVAVADEVQRGWLHRKAQGLDGESVFLDAQGHLVMCSEAASHDCPLAWGIPLDSYQ